MGTFDINTYRKPGEPLKRPRWSVRWPVALFALATVVFATTIGFVPRVNLLIEQGRIVHLVIYLAIWGASLVCLLLAAVQPNRLVRLFWALVLSVSAAASQFYYQVSGSELGPYDVVSLVQASHEAGRALEQYAQDAGWPLFILIFSLVAILAWPAPRNRLARRVSQFMCWAPAMPVLVIGGIVFLKEGGGAQGMPQHFAPLAVSAVTIGKMAGQDISAIGAQAPPLPAPGSWKTSCCWSMKACAPITSTGARATPSPRTWPRTRTGSSISAPPPPAATAATTPTPSSGWALHATT